MKRLTFLSLVLFLCAGLPATSWADPSPTGTAPGITSTLDNCSSQNGLDPTSATDYTPFTAEIVACVDGSIRTATYQLMDALSSYMAPVAGACFVLALLVFGVRLIGGERHLMQSAIGFLARLAIVAAFSYDLAGWSDSVFNIVDELTNIGGGGSPWHEIDVFLGRLFGFAPDLVIYQGLIGMIGMELFSSSVGFFLFLISLIVIIELLLFVFRVVYTYISAIVIVAFLLAISPIVIPTAVFSSQERYFRKWLDMIIAAGITPMVMFAVLSLFISIFNQNLDEIFTALQFNVSPSPSPDPLTGMVANPDLSPYWKMNQPAFSWMMPNAPSSQSKEQVHSGTKQSNEPPVQSNIAPTLSNAADMNTFNFDRIDFGPSNVDILQGVIYTLVPLWIFASLMQSMLGLVPNICNSIAGAVSNVTWEPTELEQNVRKVMKSAPQDMQKLRTSMAEERMRTNAIRERGGNPFSGQNLSDRMAEMKSSLSDFFGK